MRTFKTTVGAMMLLCCAAVSIPAAAQDIPASCDTTREEAFFRLGVRKGRSLAQQAINAVRQDTDDICRADAVVDLRGIVQGIVDGIAVPPGATELVQCHVLGQAAGLIAQLEDLQDECDGICIADGTFVGEISAQLYCALSIALGGLVPVELFVRLSTDRCGGNFQVACDTAFEQSATDDLLCLPFTEDVHTSVFREAQNNQCADNPEPPP